MIRARSALLLLPLAACDYSGDWLFSHPSEVPGVLDLGELIPVDLDTVDAQDAAIYGEVGATGSAESGGVTFSFLGTGDQVCLWVDPELASWTQSIALLGREPDFEYPDNFFDDGDLDLFAGFSVYYTGSPGERIGDFALQYEDSLGNPVDISLNECTIGSYQTDTNGHAGRGVPEHCTLSATQPGVSYTVLMEAFSTPLDDDRLGFGLILSQGSCNELSGGIASIPDECVILGEANDIASTVISEDGKVTVGEPLAGSEEFERSFCHSIDAEYPATLGLPEYCIEEAAAKNCAEVPCYCGDPSLSPTAGME
jgi:hypothetical protein